MSPSALPPAFEPLRDAPAPESFSPAKRHHRENVVNSPAGEEIPNRKRCPRHVMLGLAGRCLRAPCGTCTLPQKSGDVRDLSSGCSGYEPLIFKTTFYESSGFRGQNQPISGFAWWLVATQVVQLSKRPCRCTAPPCCSHSRGTVHSFLTAGFHAAAWPGSQDKAGVERGSSVAK